MLLTWTPRLYRKLRFTYLPTALDSADGNPRCRLADGSSGFSISGNKKWQTGAHSATHFLVFARTSGKSGSPRGITAFIVPRDTPGVTVASYEYTLNMPTDHATILLEDVRVPGSAVLGPLDNGLAIAQTFTHENRIRQAASSCGAAQFCVDRSVAYARGRIVFGKPLSANQAIQWPLVELSTQLEMCKPASPSSPDVFKQMNFPVLTGRRQCAC